MANLTVNTKKYGQITLNTKPHSDPPVAIHLLQIPQEVHDKAIRKMSNILSTYCKKTDRYSFLQLIIYRTFHAILKTDGTSAQIFLLTQTTTERRIQILLTCFHINVKTGKPWP